MIQSPFPIVELLQTEGADCIVNEPPNGVLDTMALEHMKSKLLIRCKRFTTPVAYVLMGRAPILRDLNPS